MSLIEYVYTHAVRGSCTCGRCIDAPKEATQPDGHTADLVFFKVANNGADSETLRKLISEHNGDFLFDGKEHNYMEIGGWIGDQGLALMLMGLGTILGLWTLMSPAALGLPKKISLSRWPEWVCSQSL